MTVTLSFQSSLLPSFLGQPRTRITLDFASGVLSIRLGSVDRHVRLDQIQKVAIAKGVVFSQLQLSISGATESFNGFSRTQLVSISDAIAHRMRLPSSVKRATQLQAVRTRLMASAQYLSRSRFDALVSDGDINPQEVGADLDYAIQMGCSHFGLCDLESLRRDVDAWTNGDLRERHNQRVMTAHREQYASLFASVEKTPLSAEQIDAVLINEDRNLVVASAGSGKTSTIVGKVGYLLASGHSQPGDIITLAFARDAARELSQRLKSRLSGVLRDDQRIEASTFHSLGLSIIGQATGIKPDVCSAPDVMIDECISDLCKTNSRFNRTWQLFQAIYSRQIQTLPEFSSQHAYSSYLKACGARRKQGETLRIPTLRGDFVASMEEVLIANWLYCKGIEYEYERPYPYVTADQQRRQYHPDFYFPQADIYLEHLGIDQNGKPAPFLGQAYLDSIQWKRELHKQKGTVLFESTSGMVRSGVIFNFLGTILEKHGITPSPRSTTDIQQALLDNNIKVQSNQRLVASFIHHLKSNELTPDDLREQNKIASGSREELFLAIVRDVLHEYNSRLSSLNQVDFDDMIISATRYLKEGKASLPYKVFIVDEFQDLAASRANLIKAALALQPQGMLFAVGDDWQAIYRFAGSDISAMTRFKEQFGAPAVSLLTQTYRSNQGITDAASAFIQKNPGQIRKNVRAFNTQTNGVIDLVRCERPSLIVEAVFAKISEIVASATKRPEVFILCRYNREMEPFINSPHYQELSKKAAIKVMTFHTSKGLEADYVFIPGLSDGSFPSSIVDDPLLGLVMPAPEAFPMAEERRVFYVAMTRARHHVYAYAEAGNESPFFLELEKTAAPVAVNRDLLDQAGLTIKQINITWCKACTGYMVPRTSKHGPFRGCSNYPDCTHTIDGHADGCNQPSRRLAIPTPH